MDELIQKSNYKILNYKLELHKLYTIIFKFCKDNYVIISNYNYNISTINKENYDLIDINYDFKFILFSFNPKKDAINLVNKLYANYSKYTFMSSYINNKEILITVDNIKIINIYQLFEVEKNIVNKISFLYDNNNHINYLPNYIELFYLSHKIYHPTYFLDFIKYEKDNKNIINKVEGFNINYIFYKLLDSINETNKMHYKNLSGSFNDNKIKENIINNLVNVLSNNYEKIKLILLDINAIQTLLTNKLIYDNNLYFIINNIENNINLIMNIIKDFLLKNNLIEYYDIHYKISSFYICNDFRLKKYIIKLFNKKDNKFINIITFYNSIDYELIPIVKKINNILIPYPIVILRFLLLNLISLQLFDKNYNERIYLNFLYNIQNCKKLFIKYDNIYYEGIFIDEKIDKFKLGVFVYRPWQYFIKNNKLLSFN